MLSPENTRILKEIGRWKVVRLNDLHRVLKHPISRWGLYKSIKRLEKDGLVVGHYFPQKGKYVGLTEKGSVCSPCGTALNPDTAIHDLMVTDTLFKLLEFESFTSANVGEDDGPELCPDGVIHVNKDGRSHLLALEVELTRKSRHRVENKFALYSGDPDLGNVLYVTNKKNLFEAYVKILSGMRKEVQETIIISWDEYLGTKNYDYRKAVYWFDGDFASFEVLFGGESV